MRTLTDLSAEVLRHAVKCGIISDQISEILGGGMPSDLEIPTYLIRDMSASPSLVQNPHQFEPFEHPDSRRYQIHTFGPALNPDTEAFRCVEAARFVVPDGQLGIITKLEQVLYDNEGSIYPTANEYWGSPYSVNDDVNQNFWYLTVDYFDGQQPERFNITSGTVIRVEHLPGYPYPEINQIQGIWYPPSAPIGNLNWIVPSQRMLRLFWLCPPTINYTWRGGGRLTGFTQSTYSNGSLDNSRKNYS